MKNLIENGDGRTIPFMATGGAAVTPSDSADLTKPATAGLHVRTGGNVTVDTIDGSEGLVFAVNDGGFLPVQVRRVRATGTTASNIVALW